MANPTISKQQMLHLLDKLSSDDGFRSRFEQHPKSALAEAGISAAQIANFPAVQLAPNTLADKHVFAAERQRVAHDLADECMCMIIPQPHLGPPRKPRP